MPKPCLIELQMEGLSLKTTDDFKIEYHLKATSGRVVMSFDNEKRALQESENRGLTCFRITTISEKI